MAVYWEPYIGFQYKINQSGAMFASRLKIGAPDYYIIQAVGNRMELLLLLFIIALLCGGFGVFYSANSYRKEGTTGIRYADPKHWFVPIWKAGKFREVLKPEGYRRFLIGWIMISLGGALLVVYYAIESGRL